MRLFPGPKISIRLYSDFGVILETEQTHLKFVSQYLVNLNNSTNLSWLFGTKGIPRDPYGYIQARLWACGCGDVSTSSFGRHLNPISTRGGQIMLTIYTNLWKPKVRLYIKIKKIKIDDIHSERGFLYILRIHSVSHHWQSKQGIVACSLMTLEIKPCGLKFKNSRCLFL